MPRDLFEEAGIEVESNQRRDLLGEQRKSTDLFKNARIKIPEGKSGAPTSDEMADFIGKIPEAGYSLLTGAAQGAIDLGTMPGNLLAKGINSLAGKPIAPIVDIDIASEQIGGMPKYAFPQFLGQGAALVATPLGEVKAFSNMLNKAPAALQALRSLKWGAKGADIAATGALYGEAFNADNPDEGLGEGAKSGALLNLALTPLFRAPGAIRQRMIDKTARDAYQGGMGIRTPEEVASISAMLGDLPVDFGTLINAPTKKDIYKNWLSAIPFSGVKPKMQQVVAAADDEASNILNYYLGDKAPSEVGKSIRNELSALKKETELTSTQNYGRVLSRAEEQGVNVNNRQTVSRLAQRYLKEIEQAEKSGDLSVLSEKDIPVLNRLIKKPGERKIESAILDEYGKPILTQGEKVDRSAREAMKTYSRLGRIESKYAEMGDLEKANRFTRLRKAMSKDIEKSLKKSGNQELYDAWLRSNNYHREEVIPFRDPKITSFINGLTGSKKAHTLLDDFEKYPSVVNKLSDETRKNLIFQKMSSKLRQDEQGELVARPYLLSSTYDKLDPALREQFMTKNERYILNRLNAIDSIAREYRPVLNAPQTGALQKNLSVASKALTLPIAAAAIGYNSSDEHQVRNALLASALGLGTSPITRMYANRLTSPGLRKDYISGKVNPSKKFKKSEDVTRKIIINAKQD